MQMANSQRVAVTLASIVAIILCACYKYRVVKPTNGIEPLNLNRRQRLVPFDDQMLAELSTHPWSRDPYCSHFDVKFARTDSLPLTVLTSFPGSGVTWFRQLVEGATGVYTSTVYDGEPPILKEANYGNYVDAECNCTVLEKNHEATASDGFKKYFRQLHRFRASRKSKLYGNRGVLLLRNPMDAAVAYRNYLTAGQTGMAEADRFQGAEWEEFVRFAAFAWADHATRWIDRIQTGTVVFYENLVHNTEAELNRVIPHFYPEPIRPMGKRLDCAIRHKHRVDRKRPKRTKVVWTADQRKLFNESIENVRASLRIRNWPQMPTSLYHLS